MGSVARNHIGETLERLRQAAGIERLEAAIHVGKSKETVRRWETGAVCPDSANIKDLCNLYRAGDETMSYLCGLALKSKDTTLFEGMNVPDGLRMLVEGEATARKVQSVETLLVPGLLQTMEYHRATQAAQLPGDEEKRREFRELRQRRHEAVFRDPPELQFVLSESVIDLLNRWNDAPARQQQIDRLLKVGTLPSVEIRVITGFHAAMLGAFTVVTPRRRSSRPFAYVQDVDGARYVEPTDVVSAYERTFNHVRDSAIPLEEYLT